MKMTAYIRIAIVAMCALVALGEAAEPSDVAKNRFQAIHPCSNMRWRTEARPKANDRSEHQDCVSRNDATLDQPSRKTYATSSGAVTTSADSNYRTHDAKILRDFGAAKRSEAAKNQFKAAYPCPRNGMNHGACPGWVIDHVIPLACGGEDDSSNMQWQTEVQAKAKDKWERRGCTAVRANTMRTDIHRVKTAKRGNVTMPTEETDTIHARVEDLHIREFASVGDTAGEGDSISGYSGSGTGPNTIYTGPRGGRYTYSQNGSKRYVGHSRR